MSKNTVSQVYANKFPKALEKVGATQIEEEVKDKEEEAEEDKEEEGRKQEIRATQIPPQFNRFIRPIVLPDGLSYLMIFPSILKPIYWQTLYYLASVQCKSLVKKKQFRISYRIQIKKCIVTVNTKFLITNITSLVMFM